jgi:superfamily II DNA/RNA helicase
VAARGIHIKRLNHVVNYDFPSNIEQYCHRVGRTGRQGASGNSYSLLTRQLAPLCSDLISLLKECGQVVEPNLQALHEDFVIRGILCQESGDENDGGDEDA